ncbi:MAG: aminotransferase class IV [Planctomycetota bacterium]
MAGHTAKVSIYDRGFLYGDGLFETMKAVDGTVEHLDDHLARLAASARALAIPVPDTDWQAVIGRLLARNKRSHGVARVKIILTRGVMPGLGLACNKPTLVITAVPQPARPAPQRIGIYPERRLEPVARHKSLNYLFNLLAHDWAVRQGLDEAVIIGDRGQILECSTANLFVIRGKTVLVPKNEGYLEGIAGRYFLARQQTAGRTVRMRRIYPRDLRPADEIWITNSMLGACRVRLVP